MRVELDLPDWVDERRVVILAGVEEVAHYEPTGGWKIKTGRCSRCGKCCGPCEYLNENRCSLNARMPWECLTSDGVDTVKECTVTWRTV